MDSLNMNLSKSKSTSSIHSSSSASVSASPTKKSSRFMLRKDKDRMTIFGPGLSTIKLDEVEGVPKFVVECVKLIEATENIQTNGIYRASGNKNSIELVKKRMNNDRQYLRRDTVWQFLEKQDVHTLTGSLKLFFRCLNEPLIPERLLKISSERTLGKVVKERRRKEVRY